MRSHQFRFSLFFLFSSFILFNCKSAPVLQEKMPNGYEKYKVKLGSFENKDDAKKRLIKYLGCNKADIKDEDFKIEVIVDNNYPGGMSNTIKKKYYFSTLKCKEEPKKKAIVKKKKIKSKKEIPQKKISKKTESKPIIAKKKKITKKENTKAKESFVKKTNKKTSNNDYPSFEDIAGKENKNNKFIFIPKKKKEKVTKKRRAFIPTKNTSTQPNNNKCITAYCKKKRIPDQLNDSAISMAKEGNIHHAIDNFKKASAIQDKEAAKTYNNMGYAYELAGKQTKAIIAYRKALKRNPKLLTSLQHLVRLYYLKGMKSTARKYKRRVLYLDPKNTFVKKYK